MSQWLSTVDTQSGLLELQALKDKYQWLRCDKSLEFLTRMSKDLPMILKIIQHQEKQNAIHRKFIEVNQLADEAIVKAITYKFGLDG